jgi:hypothetical protein
MTRRKRRRLKKEAEEKAKYDEDGKNGRIAKERQS